jgi:hypothetical protein
MSRADQTNRAMPAIQLSEIGGGQQRRKGRRFQVVTENHGAIRGG